MQEAGGDIPRYCKVGDKNTSVALLFLIFRKQRLKLPSFCAILLINERSVCKNGRPPSKGAAKRKNSAR